MNERARASVLATSCSAPPASFSEAGRECCGPRSADETSRLPFPHAARGAQCASRRVRLRTTCAATAWSVSTLSSKKAD
eukprot:5126676-Pleurochrysis_carterae.AAC.2